MNTAATTNQYANPAVRYGSLENCIQSALAQYVSTFVVYKVGGRFYTYYWTSEEYANSRDDMPGKYYCTVTTTPR